MVFLLIREICLITRFDSNEEHSNLRWNVELILSPSLSESHATVCSPAIDNACAILDIRWSSRSGYGFCGEPSQLLQLLRTSIRHRSSSGRVACGVSTRGALGLLSRVRNVGEVRRSG